MSDNCRELLRDGLAFTGALAIGLLTGWLVLKLQKPEPSTTPWWISAPASQEQQTQTP